MVNLFLAGSINGRGDYEGDPLSGSQNDAVLSKYAPGGQLVWSLRFGGNADDLAQDVAADGYGGVFATGTFEGSVQFGDYELISRGGRDGFVLRLNANGEVLWATSFGGPGDEQAYTLHITMMHFMWGALKRPLFWYPLSLHRRKPCQWIYSIHRPSIGQHHRCYCPSILPEIRG